MTEYVCKICNNSKNNKSFIAKEMMYGIRDKFEYFKCSNCGCLQIFEVPKDLSKFYPSNYYSYSDYISNSKTEKVKIILKKKLIKYKLGQKSIIGFVLSQFFHNFHWIIEDICNLDSKILDIGCGNGEILIELSKLGFKNLKGLDPFISKDQYYSNGVTILKKEITGLDEKFDFIMLHHSFEHMDNPKKILQQINNYLNPLSIVLIRIPISSCFAFRKYETNWVQLDAPRHLFLHTQTSMKILANETGFKIFKIIYDSTSFQFIGSEKYENDIPLLEDYCFTKKQTSFFNKETKRLNSLNDGDSACFYLQKI